MPARTKKPADETGFGTFEGKPIVSRAIRMNLGAGLSEAFKVQPRDLHVGDQVFFTGSAIVVSAEFDPTKDDGGFERSDVLKGELFVFIDEETNREALDAQRLRYEAAKGIQQLPWNEPADNADELQAHHDAGEHADALRDGCPACIAERLAADSEKRGRRGRKSTA